MNKTLTEYKFAGYPSNSSVASGVTLLVSAWFLVAAGAILADPPSVYTQRVVAQAAAVPAPLAELAPLAAPAELIPAVALVPDARFTIKVEARRLKV